MFFVFALKILQRVHSDKPAVAQGDEGRAHILHRYRRHSGLHRGRGQLQQVADILHQRAAHDKDQQLLLPGPIPVQQQEQRHKDQAYAEALQQDDVVYHFSLTCPCLLFCVREGG